jgi:hypothetical protein
VRRTGWIGAVALVVLAGRAIAYALSPSPLAADFAGRAGGPALPLVAAVSLGLGAFVSAAVVWLAALGVRERRLLEARPLASEPRLRLRRLAARAVLLSSASIAGFALLESYVHWRAGLGWHGLHCLTAPAHANALPILVALSTVAAAAASAAEHVLAWMRRVLATLARVHAVSARPAVGVRLRATAGSAVTCAAVARGPPLAS